MNLRSLCLLTLLAVPAMIVLAPRNHARAVGQDSQAAADSSAQEESPVQIEYLEIVTPDVDATCEALEASQGARFGKPIPELGNARTAQLASGGRVGVRGPMRADEAPVVRPYVLVEDIEAALAAAKAAGGEVAIPPMELPGQGKFAIYLLGGIDHGLWQN